LRGTAPPRFDEEGRARLCSTAETTAVPKLRLAIEKAAAGANEAEMEATLAELEAEGEVRVRDRS
jgi:hypothetical protein